MMGDEVVIAVEVNDEWPSDEWFAWLREGVERGAISRVINVRGHADRRAYPNPQVKR